MLHPRTDPGDTTVASLQSGRQWFARVAFVLDVKTISLPPADALFTLRADVSFIGIDLSAHVPVIEHCFQVLVIMDFGRISNPQANAYRDRMTAISLDCSATIILSGRRQLRWPVRPDAGRASG